MGDTKIIKQALERARRTDVALTFDDVRLRTTYSDVMPDQVDLTSRFSRNITLNIPIVSAAMDTVTEYQMAISMAKLGGLGILHKGMDIETQVNHLKKVKYHLHGRIEKPICVNQNDTISSILTLRDEKGYSFSSFPVLDKSNKIIGVVTGRDFDYCTDSSKTIEQIMTRDPKTADEHITTDIAYELMMAAKASILPILNSSGDIVGLYTFKDLKRIKSGSGQYYNLDASGRLRVGAAIGTGDAELERAAKLHEKGVDVIVIDTAHGDSSPVYETLRALKNKIPNLDVVVGNISVGNSAKRLVDAGADGIKVGQGPGSICTTRVVAGIGRPQVSAVYDCFRLIYGSGVPICADGGLTNSGDIPVAIGAGADNVMMGSMLAGTDESPGEIVFLQGRKWKSYRGMGSIGAMRESAGARARYNQSGNSTLVPEGIEGLVAYKGSLEQVMTQYIGGLRKGMGYTGSRTVSELIRNAQFDRITSQGMKESHPHDITITKEAPNYRTNRG